MNNSVRAERTLAEFGVTQAFRRGDRFLLVGPIYTLRADPQTRVRLAFSGPDKTSVEVGYAAAKADAGWRLVESEPYSLRSFGYYQRRLKRIGDWSANAPAEAFLELPSQAEE